MENTSLISFAGLWRGLLSIILGLCMVIWPSFAAQYIVVIIGSVLILAGLVMIVLYFARRRRRRDEQRLFAPGLIIAGAACLIGGIVLVSMSATFVPILIVLMGILLLLVSIDQIWMLARVSRRGVKVPVESYILPVLVFVVGVVMTANPWGSLNVMLIAFGATAIVYGITDIANQRFIKRS